MPDLSSSDLYPCNAWDRGPFPRRKQVLVDKAAGCAQDVRNARRKNGSVSQTRKPAWLSRSECPALWVILRVHFISDVLE